ncbi:hypothetical protein [Bacillus sp. V5-8f]|uniref:hypothetical protein n=1 Tax=Bacillus sp. V5-8f TaxID=2053044 RepID=UPI001C609022|nr:hypothetical protein [Bacillus sp. V5-8f]
MSLFLIARLKGVEKEVRLMADRESGRLSFSVQVVDSRTGEGTMSTWEDAKELLMRVSGKSLILIYSAEFCAFVLGARAFLGKKKYTGKRVSDRTHE